MSSDFSESNSYVEEFNGWEIRVYEDGSRKVYDPFFDTWTPVIPYRVIHKEKHDWMKEGF